MSLDALSRAMLAGCALVALTGCSSPRAEFGQHARYAPAYGGYVLGPEDGSDDPDEEDVLVLRDPLDGSKFRCREELQPWIRQQQRATRDDASDEHWAIASPLIMLPHLLAAALAFDVLLLNVGIAELPYRWGRPDSPEELYDEAEEHVRGQRWLEVATTLEQVLMRSPSHRAESRALYYLGIAYAQTGRHQRARRALHAFVSLSRARDAEAYRKAERWLRYLGDAPSSCESQEPIRLTW